LDTCCDVEFDFLAGSGCRGGQETAGVGRKYDSVAGECRWNERCLAGGRRDVPGESFTYAFFIPAGYHEHHWHSSDARVVVVQGALKVSFGETLDLEHLKTYPTGTYLLVPANVKHTMAADADTVIIGTAVGPWSTHHQGEHQHH